MKSLIVRLSGRICYLTILLMNGALCSAEDLFEMDRINPILKQDPAFVRIYKRTSEEIERAEKRFSTTTLRSYENYRRILKRQLPKARDKDAKTSFEAEIARIDQFIQAVKKLNLKWVASAADKQAVNHGGQSVNNLSMPRQRWAAAKVNLRDLAPIRTGDHVVQGDTVKPKWRRKSDFVIDDFESGVAIDNLHDTDNQTVKFESAAPTALGGTREVLLSNLGVARLALTSAPDAIQVAGQGGGYSTGLTIWYRNIPAPFDATKHGNAFYIRLRKDPGRGRMGFALESNGYFGAGAFVPLNGSRLYITRFNDQRFKGQEHRFKNLKGFSFQVHFEGKPALIEVEEWGITHQ